jgi:diguanylate cyclase (GGDEF)-like protein/PAS domain S-box-containing protein
MSFAVIATAVAGLAIVAVCAVALVRAGAPARPAIAATGLAFLVWAGGSVGVLLSMPAPIFWAGVRPAVFALICAVILTAPGVRRSASEWLDVLLDGVITTCGVFATLWFLIHLQLVFPLTPTLGWMTLWLAFQFLLMVPLAGLLNRAIPGRRLPPVLAFCVTTMVMAGDMLALLSGQPQTGIPFWLGGGLLVATALLIVGEVFFETFDDPTRPRQIRWWQLPILPVLLYAIVPAKIDEIVIGLACLAFATMCAHLIVHSTRNERLWDSLSARSRLYRDVLRDSQDAILMLDAELRIEYANAATEAVLGTRPEDMIGRTLADWVLPEDSIRARAEVAEFDFSTGSKWRIESRFKGDDGVLRTIEWAVSQRGETPGYALSGRDFSERNHLQRELLTAARTDSLTGLLNRAAFLAETGERLDQGAGAALMLIDLDGFKQVNDTMGHATGDVMLRRASQWLAQAAGDDDLVARLGGDEFAILAGSTDPVEVMDRAHAMVGAFTDFDPDPHGRPPVSVSVGVVIARSGTGTDLLRDADLAMYRAKARGGACAVRFEPWMSERVLERSRLLTNLESAIQHGGLVLHMQPVVALPGAHWIGFEALVRWPVAGRLRPPDEFLPLAQESGLIVPMGAWVLTEALRQLASWPDRTMTLAVNVSAQQLAAPSFCATVMSALQVSGIEPERLTLEITEQTAIQDLGRTASRLDELRAEGVRTAIDDFGTGFSSMQYLARLPVDTLKIDRKFVWGLGEQGDHAVLVRSMIRLAAEMGFDVVAEGVETQAQADLLVEYGCRHAQGYLFSRPRPIQELHDVELGVVRV